MPRQNAPDFWLEQFHTWNVWLAILFTVQAAAILLLSATHDVTITASYLAPNSLLSGANRPVLVAAVHRLFEVNVGLLLSLFLLFAGLAHAIAASVYRKRYEIELSRGVNRVRWLEYAVTAALVMAVVALLDGVYDISSLLMIMALTATMYLVGLFVDMRWGAKTINSWADCRLAALVGLLPAGVLLIYFLETSVYGRAHLPTFLYYLYGSLGVIFLALATNFYLQHARRGKWADYLYGERIFMIISLLAKTAVAWQIFAGLLHP